MGLELLKADIKYQPASPPEARGGPEVNYEPLHPSSLPVQLWLLLESGSHESHISCGLEGDPIPRQRGGQKGPEPDKDPVGPQGCLQVVAGAQVIRVLAPSPFPGGLAPKQQHPMEEQPSPAEQGTRHTRVGHEGQRELRQRHSACKREQTGSGGSSRPRPPKPSCCPPATPSPVHEAKFIPPPANSESLFPSRPLLGDGNTPVTRADIVLYLMYDFHSCIPNV